MTFLVDSAAVLLATFRDILPILGLIVCFQLFVLRQPIPNLRRLIIGGVYVVVGLAMFLIGLQKALFPVGKLMALQLSDPVFLAGEGGVVRTGWTAYGWVYLFAALIGFSTAIAEPSLLAVALKAGEVSSGVISPWGLRITVAVGVAVGISLGAFRIVTGTPLHVYILAGYIVVVLQTFTTPKKMIPLAYDSGGVASSTVTVPLVAALGLGLSEAVPGRDPALDGFGLIAFAALFPIISVMGYAQVTHWFVGRRITSPFSIVKKLLRKIRNLPKRRRSMRFKIVYASVKTHITDPVVDAAKAAGATGATIIPARGTGMHEAKTFFGLTLEDQTDIVMFLLEEHLVKPVLQAIKTAGKFDRPGTGIAFVLPVEQVVGLESQMEKFKQEVRDKYL